jgi:MoxR-like ATPase
MTNPHADSGMTETVTLKQAKALLHAMAHEQSLLLLSPPGVGKSDTVVAAAAEAGLPCRSLLGTQIAPEDVSGIPRIVGERSVFCPPRLLLPENPEPFCLFLDELPATTPDIQKAFYSLLLERRLGEHKLPAGTWVVAAGNRAEDRALVRSMSSALVNRVVILQIRVDVKEWMQWAAANRVRPEILAFINFLPEALMRPVPANPVPFSTPRSWASFSRALELTDAAGILDRTTRRALAFGRISAEDAAVFCAMAEEAMADLLPVSEYLNDPGKLPKSTSELWFVLCRVRRMAHDGGLKGLPPETINRFLAAIPLEHRLALFVDLVETWGSLGADAELLAALRELTGLSR